MTTVSLLFIILLFYSRRSKQEKLFAEEIEPASATATFLVPETWLPPVETDFAFASSKRFEIALQVSTARLEYRFWAGSTQHSARSVFWKKIINICTCASCGFMWQGGYHHALKKRYQKLRKLSSKGFICKSEIVGALGCEVKPVVTASDHGLTPQSPKYFAFTNKTFAW